MKWLPLLFLAASARASQTPVAPVPPANALVTPLQVKAAIATDPKLWENIQTSAFLISRAGPGLIKQYGPDWGLGTENIRKAAAMVAFPLAAHPGHVEKDVAAWQEILGADTLRLLKKSSAHFDAWERASEKEPVIKALIARLRQARPKSTSRSVDALAADWQDFFDGAAADVEAYSQWDKTRPLPPEHR